MRLNIGDWSEMSKMTVKYMTGATVQMTGLDEKLRRPY